MASTLGLSSAVMGYLWNANQPIETIIPICLLLGAVLGAVNGFFVTVLGLPSLAVTIGTLALYRGLAFVVLGDGAVADFPAVYTDWVTGNHRRYADPERAAHHRRAGRRLRRGPARHPDRPRGLRGRRE